MRHLIVSTVALALFLAPLSAEAGFVIEGSAGKGAMVKPSFELIDTNLMFAAGWGFDEWIRLELGVVTDLGDAKNSQFALRLRPMLVIKPPLIPIHARAIVGLANVTRKDRQVEFGAAVGLSGSLFGLGLFIEAGMVPQAGDGGIQWLAEGRGGVYYIFD
jgi:hypothetical protein